MTLEVDLSDLHRDQLAFIDKLIRGLDGLVSQLCEVKESHDVWGKFHEHAKRNDLGDRPSENPADLIRKPNGAFSSRDGSCHGAPGRP